MLSVRIRISLYSARPVSRLRIESPAYGSGRAEGGNNVKIKIQAGRKTKSNR